MSDIVSFQGAGGRSERGARPTQRDFYNVRQPGQLIEKGGEKLAFFAVYDGHGSDKVSKHASKHLPGLLANVSELLDGEFERVFEKVIQEEEALLKKSHLRKYGSAVAVCFVDLTTGVLVAGNLGDSHVLLSEWGHEGQVDIKRLTESHRPSNPLERSRIVEAGGFIAVDEDGTERLGPLSMSRALGDLDLKEALRCRAPSASPPSDNADGPLSSQPFLRRVQLREDRRYHIALVSDGVTDELGDHAIMNQIADHWHAGLSPGDISKRITIGVSQKFGSDNATCVCVFLSGRSV